ncbi:MAG: aspartate-alanine antiporter [Muribaculaceae bacterium]|nr:aspartate-alanine antiporter [Muribaculaceae bacterium]
MESFIDILRSYPVLALFLTIGLGFLLGRLRIGSFKLGSVTAVLLIGVVVGQTGIKLSGPIKMVFFMMFLFSIGYSVGPGFFRSLRGSGLRQVIFAVILSTSCFAVTLAISYLFGYSKGETVGLFSGAQTCSALLGVGGEAISKLPIADALKERELFIIPVCYAVTYIFGTLGTVIILGTLGPKLLGGIDKVKRLTEELGKELNDTSWQKDPANINARRAVPFRAYRLTDSYFSSHPTVRRTEQYLRENQLPIFISRIDREGQIILPSPEMTLHPGDEIVVSGQRRFMVKAADYLGHEVDNHRLLTYPVERLPVTITSRQYTDQRLEKIIRANFMHGVSIRGITRAGKEQRVAPDTMVHKGDIITLLGTSDTVAAAGSKLGHIDRPTNASDLMFVGLAIFIGGFLGALSIWIGGIPLSFGTSGGSLVAGIVFGWLRSRRPTFGQIPPAALWIMNNLGLNVFIAVVGIEAGPSFVAGLKSVGWMLFLAGAVATTLPLLLGLWLGHRVFKFNPAITLGCCAGTRTCTASLGAIQDSLSSTLPAMGYTVTYAVSNILLVVWGLVTVMLVP